MKKRTKKHFKLLQKMCTLRIERNRPTDSQDQTSPLHNSGRIWHLTLSLMTEIKGIFSCFSAVSGYSHNNLKSLKHKVIQALACSLSDQAQWELNSAAMGRAQVGLGDYWEQGGSKLDQNEYSRVGGHHFTAPLSRSHHSKQYDTHTGRQTHTITH